MHNESNSEQDLISGAQRGDQEAMKTIYLLHVRYLSAVCSRYVSNSEDVRDILQDSFLKIFREIDKYKPRQSASLRSWMTRIVVNDTLKFLQKNNRMTFITPVQEYPDIADEEPPDVQSLPYEVTRQLIEELPTGYRTVFNLYVFEKKSHKEIAHILGIKEDTSASQFHRAKKILAEKIKQFKKGASL